MTDGNDPRTYDYSTPPLECDVVMKGGITSGVVYPHAVCELARTYRFRSIGGTSAGAIAAAAAAAAEYGRESGGFTKLAALPEWVGSGTNLFDLFQPHRRTRALFHTFTAGLGKSGVGKLLAVCGRALAAFWLAAVAGALPGALVVALGIGLGGGVLLKAVTVVVGIVLALLGAVLALLVRMVTAGPRAIVANGYGLCSGMPSGDASPPALTPWLAGVIEDLAGRKGEHPLTFGDLRAHGIELAMVTTNLTQRRAHRLPWSERVFFFDPVEWRALFPEHVVRWMEEHPPPTAPGGGEDPTRIREAMLPRLPFPTEDDLPVVVAARMSLSFPVLINAVPLWAFDRTLGRNNEALAGKPGVPDAVPECVWFSDGGISSNFPVHFFDAPLPTRPTFAIDLDGFHPDHPKQPVEVDNVYLPKTNVGGILERWHRLPAEPGFGALAAFVSGMVRTMQNRVDTSLARLPGYRDRIVHVHTDPSEGGMNLTMPPEVIDALTRRGQEAARQLVHRFAETPGTDAGLSWDSHRWVRYRTALTALAEQLDAFAAAWQAAPAAERSYGQLADRGREEGPAAARFVNAEQRGTAVEMSRRLADAAEAVRAASTALDKNSPHPAPVSRIVPRD
jgi:predicted acylesterase/phospholipase RssA